MLVLESFNTTEPTTWYHVASSPCMTGSHRASGRLCRTKDANLVLHVAPRGPLELQPQFPNFGMRRGIGAAWRDADLGSGPGCGPLPSVTSSWRPCAVAEQEPRLHRCGNAVAGRLGNKMQLARLILEVSNG